MAFDCDNCTGSRYLGDVPGLGRCVCVTPENMKRAERAAEETDNLVISLCEALRLPDDAGLLDRVSSYVEAVDEVFSDISAGRDKQGDPDDLREKVNAALDQAYEDGGTGKAADALQDYLVSINLPSAPAGATGNAALDKLIDLIL